MIVVWLLIILCFICASSGFIYIVISKKTIHQIASEYCIPHGTIIATDLNTPSAPLFSQSEPLCGKPDYIIKTKQAIFPAEVKTGNHLKTNHHHVMQLIAYCHLVEETYHQTVPYGLLIYHDTKSQFQIPYSPQAKKELKTTINHMRTLLETQDINAVTLSQKNCDHCSMSTHCQWQEYY